jgi:hypothetical protein
MGSMSEGDGGIGAEEARLLSRQPLILRLSTDPLLDVRLLCGDGKAIPSEYGWFFLVNDSNKFLDVQFGENAWSSAEIDAARGVIKTRLLTLEESGARYFKFIVPECLSGNILNHRNHL